jgi:HAD superfamily hydrolase (TIGR01509 family)
MAELKALIFDVDGTLAETERDAHRVAFNESFAAHHLDWHWDVALYGELLTITGGKERMKFYHQQYRPIFPLPDDLDAFISKLHLDKTARYNEILVRQPIPLRPGVVRLIMEARQKNIALAIATTTSLRNVTTLLENSLAPDSLDWFDVIAAGDVVSAKKPAPDIYYVALEKLALPAEQCVAIEDSYNGLCSAKGANLRTIITVSDYTRHEDFSGAELVLNHLGEPEQPVSVLAGKMTPRQYVDIAFLRELCEVQ